jgi:hypothetical protein
MRDADPGASFLGTAFVLLAIVGGICVFVGYMMFKG